MEFIAEILFQFLGEVLLQLFFEWLVELGSHRLSERFKRPINVALSIIGFVLLGAIAGGISLWLLPRSFIINPAFRQANVVITPLIAGLVMMLIGKRRDRRGQSLVKLDRFGYAFVFALTMALIRYTWAA